MNLILYLTVCVIDCIRKLVKILKPIWICLEKSAPTLTKSIKKITEGIYYIIVIILLSIFCYQSCLDSLHNYQEHYVNDGHRPDKL